MKGVRRESSFVQPMAGQIVQPADAQLSLRSKVQSVTGQTEGKIRYAARIKSTPCGDGRPTPTITPRVRFKEFEGAWEGHFLGDLFDERLERSGEKPLLSVTMADGVIPASENGKRDNSSADKSNYKCVYPGDLAYNSMRMWQGACGASAHEGIVSPAYTVMKPNDETDSFFFTRQFKRPNFLKVLRAFSQGLTSDTWNLKFPMLATIPCHAPSLPEQQRIASFFANLDETIAAADARLGKLRQTKAALLKKMFPRQGQAVPEIRFKGFEGKWEQSMAKQIFEQTNERNHPELPVLSASQQLGMIRRDEGGMNISHDKGNEPTYKRVRPRQFVLHLRSFQGGFAHSAIDGITSPAYTVFRFKNDSAHSDRFWKIVFMSETFIKSLRTITYGIRDGRSISYEEFEEMTLSYPSLSEQKRIAAFFHEMDALISATEAEAKKLRQVKAALLEGMFVQG